LDLNESAGTHILLDAIDGCSKPSGGLGLSQQRIVGNVFEAGEQHCILTIVVTPSSGAFGEVKLFGRRCEEIAVQFNRDLS
jgi:hypothetical protein